MDRAERALAHEARATFGIDVFEIHKHRAIGRRRREAKHEDGIACDLEIVREGIAVVDELALARTAGAVGMDERRDERSPSRAPACARPWVDVVGSASRERAGIRYLPLGDGMTRASSAAISS